MLDGLLFFVLINRSKNILCLLFYKSLVDIIHFSVNILNQMIKI